MGGWIATLSIMLMLTQQPAPAHASSSVRYFFIPPPTPKTANATFQYDDFKTMLYDNQVSRVTFGLDRTSLTCFDQSGKAKPKVYEITSDAALLNELTEREVSIDLEAPINSRKMAARKDAT